VFISNGQVVGGKSPPSWQKKIQKIFPDFVVARELYIL